MTTVHDPLRPWLFGIPMTRINECETREIVLTTRRSTSSFRKLTLTAGGYGYLTVRSVKVAGRELLQSEDAVPGEAFGHDQPETFDLPIEADAPIAITLVNVSNEPIYASGYLLGMREK